MTDTLPSKDWVAPADSRCAATLLDCLFAFPCMLLISPLVDLAAASGMPWWCVGVVAMILWAAVTLFLFAALESSPLRATLGKLICGLAVVGPGGERLPFPSALKRNAVKYSTAFYGLVPLFKSNWASAGALHDVASGAAVVSRKELAS